MLTLPIKKKWFDMIFSGEKKEEYRNFNKYYGVRFAKFGVGGGQVFEVLLRNGYSSKSPTLKCLVRCDYTCGKEEWGVDKDVLCFVLSIKKVELLNE